MNVKKWERYKNAGKSLLKKNCGTQYSASACESKRACQM